MHLHLQALIPLSLEGTEVGQTKAAQALAKITITSNPEMAFPGERVSVTTEGQAATLRRAWRGQAGVAGQQWSERSGGGASTLLVRPSCCSQARLLWGGVGLSSTGRAAGQGLPWSL